MDNARVVLHKEPFWLGPFRIGNWPMRLVTENFMPDPDRHCRATTPNRAGLPSAANGMLRRSEPVNAEARAETTSSNLLRYELSRYDRQFADLTGSMDDYLARFSAKTRSTLRRKVRRFSEVSGGEIDARTFRMPDQMEEFYRHARAISEHTYQERLYDAGLPAGPEYVEKMKELAEQDRVRAWLLFLNGKPVSYLYCPVHGDRLHYEFLGFLPEYAKLSPGTVLQMLAFEDLFKEQRFRLFDFSEGEGDHKRLFGTISMPCANVLYLKPGIGARLFLALHRGTLTLSASLDRAATSLGIKTALRRMLRKQGQ